VGGSGGRQGAHSINELWQLMRANWNSNDKMERSKVESYMYVLCLYLKPGVSCNSFNLLITSFFSIELNSFFSGINGIVLCK